ncbi:MAG TPA: beta-ketoacyl-ACP synthase II [Bacteroidia bacterium]|nr:beta-ketoacyl-ACP synthase II [Bacteroidia bacterium]
MQLKRVVITGLGGITPLGNSVTEFWNNLIKGVSGAANITRFNAEKFKTRFACEVKGFNLDDYFDKKEARKLDAYSQYGIAASVQAVADSGIAADSVDKNEVGVIWGSGIGGLDTFQAEAFGFAKGDGTPRFNPFFIPKMIADICSGHISMRFGFRGPNFTTVSACASSTNALIDSFTYIRMGKANAIVTGGSEAAINECGIGGFNACQAMSTRNENPEAASRPYDKDREGFVLGEGGVAIVLEELEHAKARGAKIYAEIIGGGMSGDAHHITAPHPEGLGAKLVMQRALKDAEISPDQVDYINTHGTSTPLGDIAELKAVEALFGEQAFKMNISSTKSMTGHLLGAAGAIEAMATVLAIKNDIVPPTINFTTPDPEINPRFNLTFNKAVARKINIAISNTFGFGGHNAAVVLRKYVA